MRERLSAKTGVVIPLPDTYGKVNPRFITPMKPGSKDTDAAAVARRTYTPPPELLPYLAPQGVLFSPRGGRGQPPALPHLLRKNKFPKTVRKRMTAQWRRSVKRQWLEEDAAPLKGASAKPSLEKLGGGEAPELR